MMLSCFLLFAKSQSNFFYAWKCFYGRRMTILFVHYFSLFLRWRGKKIYVRSFKVNLGVRVCFLLKICFITGLLHIYLLLYACRYGSVSSILRYAKIAMELPSKTVRDVALRARWMNVSSLSLMLNRF